MLEQTKRVITEHKTALLAILLILLIGIAYAIGRHSTPEQTAAEKPTVMTQGDTREAERLRTQLNISRANANALQQRLVEAQEEQRAPTTTYYVSAPTVERAAREKSDRTVVAPITKNVDVKDLPQDKQKVDVYKINLRKDHRIKAGASVIDGKALMSIGYKQGRFEALAHFDGWRYKGATVMYNVAEW